MAFVTSLNFILNDQRTSKLKTKSINFKMEAETRNGILRMPWSKYDDDLFSYYKVLMLKFKSNVTSEYSHWSFKLKN
jgi:hypothetical protein